MLDKIEKSITNRYLENFGGVEKELLDGLSKFKVEYDPVFEESLYIDEGYQSDYYYYYYYGIIQPAIEEVLRFLYSDFVIDSDVSAINYSIQAVLEFYSDISSKLMSDFNVFFKNKLNRPPLSLFS